MIACVIAHDMIIEDEQNQPDDFRYENEENKFIHRLSILRGANKNSRDFLSTFTK